MRFASAVLLLLPALPHAWSDESLARFAPADVGLFVEVRGVEDLLIPLAEPEIWSALAELAGQPAQASDAEEWRKRIRQTVKMEPSEAIHTLFSRRAAFVGEGPGRSQDAVLICQLPAETDVASLLEAWQAQRQPGDGPPETYLLRTNIGLAVFDHVLVFGDPTQPTGMFPRVIQQVRTGAESSLAGDAHFAELLGRVPGEPDGVLFARLSKSPAGFAPTTQPATRPTTEAAARAALGSAMPESPGPLRGASDVLFALHREGQVLHFTAAGDARPVVAKGPARIQEVVSTLPERTLAVWGGNVDYPDLMRNIETLPDRNVFRLAVRIHRKMGTIDRLLNGLESSTCFAAGLVEPGGRAPDAPPLPAVALLVRTSDPTSVSGAFRDIFSSSASIYNLLSLSRGISRVPELRELEVESRPVQSLDLSDLIRDYDAGAVGELRLCWTMDDGVLIVASHEDWLAQVLRARHGASKTLAEGLNGVQGRISPTSRSIIIVQAGPIADLGQLWLDFFRRHTPQVMAEDWWRNKQPGGGQIRLGISVSEDAANRQLRVTAVEPDAPAGGVLRIDDRIIGCTSQRFASSQPVVEIQTAIANRPSARWLDLIVERGAQTLNLRIPLPFVNPIQTLRRAVAVGRIAQRLVYYDDVPAQSGARGFLTVELRGSQSPVFDPGGSPAVQPVGNADDPRP